MNHPFRIAARSVRGAVILAALLAAAPRPAPAPDVLDVLLRDVAEPEDASGQGPGRVFQERGLKGVAALETYLDQADSGVAGERVDRLVRDLGHAEFKVRQAASDELAALPPSVLPALQAHLKQADDPEVLTRLREAIAALRAAESSLPELRQALAGMYGEHAAELFAQRWPAILKDPHDRAAMRFLGLGSFEPIWNELANRTDDEKLRFLLLRMYAGRRKEAFGLLQGYSAERVLKMAAATWWPVEIEPLAMDGAYGWTTRAACVEGNVATRLMRLSVKMPDYGNVAERGGWVHFEQWYRATYLFTFPAYVNKGAVAYAEALDEQSGSAGLDRPDRFPIGPGRCDTFRGLPKTAALPLARIGGAEVLDWHLGARYEWAKPLFPPQLAQAVTFQANKYPAPEVIDANGKPLQADPRLPAERPRGPSSQPDRP